MHERQCGRVLRLTCQGIVITIACAFSRGVWSAPSVPVTLEDRTYLAPSPASDQFLYPVSDVSSKYVAAIGHRGTRFTANEYNAFIFDAVTGDHLWTFTQPVPADNVNFRFASIAVDGDLAVVGAAYAHIPLPGGGFAFNAGAVFVYDLTTGQLRHKLVSDSPQLNRLGGSVDILEDLIAVGDPNSAYLFDAQSGAQLARLSTSTPSMQVGGAVALTESAVVVGARRTVAPGEHIGGAITFDTDSFAEISSFLPPGATRLDAFGGQLDADGRYAIIGGTNDARVFDIFTGVQQRELTLPGNAHNFTHRVAIDGSIAFVANPVLEQAVAFDWTTGEAVQELAPSVGFSEGAEFGYHIALEDRTALVGAVGVVYQYGVVPEPAAWALMLIGLIGLHRVRQSRDDSFSDSGAEQVQ